MFSRLNARNRRITVVLFLMTLGLVAFQNCSKASFSSVEGSLTRSSPIDPKTGFAPIQVDGSSNTSANAVKLVLILDFSYSMVNELNKVKTALNAFIDEQRTRQAFDIYMYPIYDYTENAQSSDNTNIVLKAPLAEMKLRNDGTFNAAKSQFMAKLQVEIDRASVNTHDVHETGLCQVVRVIKEQKLYNAQDKLALIVVSDEDDSSLDSCMEKSTTVIVGRSIQFEADYVSTLAKGKFSGLVKSDAGGTAPFSLEPFAIAPNCGTHSIPCVAGVYQCSSTLINYIMNIPYYGTSKGDVHSISSVDECNVHVTNSRIGFGRLFVDDLKTLAGQALTQADLNNILAGTQGFIYQGESYNNFLAYTTDKFPRYNQNVAAQFIDAALRSEYHKFPELTGTANQSNAAIMNLINQKLPDPSSIAMGFVIYNPAINSTGVTCGPQDIGIFGQRYMDFVHQSGRPNLFKTESICQTNYNSPLLHVANLVVSWSAVRNYTLVGTNAAQINSIRGVEIVDAQGNILAVLRADQYTLNLANKTLIIADSVELPQGSLIILRP